jgi:hypothetical protein
LSNSSVPDLVKVTEIFLIPSSFLVAALGTADTNPHRAAVSLLALVVSGLWFACSREALADQSLSDNANRGIRRPLRIHIMLWLPLIFGTGWLVSFIAHVLLWNRPLSG